MATMKLFRSPPRNHNHYGLVPARQDSGPLFRTSTEPSITAYVGPAASTSLGQPKGIDQDNKTPGLSAGTIVAIVFSGLILIFLLTGAYTWASARHKSRRERRSAILERRSAYEDEVNEDIEMQAQRHTRESLLEQEDEGQCMDQHRRQHKFEQQQHHHQHQQYPYHHEGAGMGYDNDDNDVDDDDDEGGKEAWIEVGTARVARIRRVAAGSVSITNMGRGKGLVTLGSSQSVRDVVSLPDLAWAETLTTGGGRRPGVVSAPPPAAAAATKSSSTGSGSERSKKLQERSESRRAVKRKAIREWFARGSGGGLGPYSAAY